MDYCSFVPCNTDLKKIKNNYYPTNYAIQKSITKGFKVSIIYYILGS